MTVKKYLFLLIVVTIVSWALWFLVVTFIDPSTGASLALSLFYLTLFLSLLGTLTLLGYGLRLLTARQEMTRQRLNIALRQGVLFSLLVNICLFFKAHDKLSLITVLLTILILSLIEFFFLSLRGQAGSDRRG
jgi:hypothetical protein